MSLALGEGEDMALGPGSHQGPPQNLRFLPVSPHTGDVDGLEKAESGVHGTSEHGKPRPAAERTASAQGTLRSRGLLGDCFLFRCEG